MYKITIELNGVSRLTEMRKRNTYKFKLQNAHCLFIKTVFLYFSSLFLSDIAPDFGCPSLEGPTVISRMWLEFYCVVPTTSKDSRSRFNVTFLFNGLPDPAIPLFVAMAADGYANATLHEKYLKGHLGKWVRQRFRSVRRDYVDHISQTVAFLFHLWLYCNSVERAF